MKLEREGTGMGPNIERGEPRTMTGASAVKVSGSKYHNNRRLPRQGYNHSDDVLARHSNQNGELRPVKVKRDVDQGRTQEG